MCACPRVASRDTVGVLVGLKRLGSRSTYEERDDGSDQQGFSNEQRHEPEEGTDGADDHENKGDDRHPYTAS